MAKNKNIEKISYDRNFNLYIPNCEHLVYKATRRSRKFQHDRLKVDFGVLEENVSTLGKELAEISAFLFSIENYHQRRFDRLNEGIFSTRISNVWSMVGDDLETIFEFLTGRRIALKFVPFPQKYYEEVKSPAKLEKFDACSLFSDGLDSFVTYTQFKEQNYNIFGVNTAHNSTMIPRIKKIKSLIDSPLIYSLNLNNNLPRRASGGLQQTRCFMYICAAATYSEIHQTSKIIVGECGPVMYQPKFLPSDNVTRTTNPTLLKAAERLFSDVFNTKFKIITPFENNTKAEIISLLPREIKKNSMHYFSSCLNISHKGKMCGWCYSCLLRKLSGIVAGANDSDFENDILIKNTASPKDLIDLVPFLQFCKNTLNDFLNLDYETKFIIEQYKKEELFVRNSLDILAGLYLLYIKNKNGKNKYAADFIKNA